MNTILWKVAALLISVPTTLPFSGVHRDTIASPIPGHRVTSMTCTWGDAGSTWLTIIWWQDALPAYPGQPIEELETWQVKFLDRASTVSRVRSAGSSSIKPGEQDDAHFQFASRLDANGAYIKIAARGISKDTFTNLVQSIRLHSSHPLKDEALICETVKS